MVSLHFLVFCLCVICPPPRLLWLDLWRGWKTNYTRKLISLHMHSYTTSTVCLAKIGRSLTKCPPQYCVIGQLQLFIGVYSGTVMASFYNASTLTRGK